MSPSSESFGYKVQSVLSTNLEHVLIQDQIRPDSILSPFHLSLNFLVQQRSANISLVVAPFVKPLLFFALITRTVRKNLAEEAKKKSDFYCKKIRNEIVHGKEVSLRSIEGKNGLFLLDVIFHFRAETCPSK